MNAPVLPDSHAIAVRVAFRGSLLREAAARIVQAAHLDATLQRDLAGLSPRDAADLRVALAQQDVDLLDVLIPQQPEPQQPKPTNT